MSRVIIFDFDGVLVDSVDALFAMNQEALRTLGKDLSKEEYLSCFEEHINKRLVEHFSLSEHEKEEMLERKAELFPRYYHEPKITLFPFAENLIHKAHALGELWIVSTARGDLITALLDKHNLTQYFSKIIGQNKQPKQLFFQESLSDRKKGEVFFITDTTGDLKEMRKAAVPASTIAVTWGFHNASLLALENPNVLATTPEEILTFIESQ